MLHPAPKPQNLELDHELLNLDHANRGHRPDGKFMSNQEMEMIAAHQDEIQGSLGDYQAAKQSAEWSTDADKFAQKYNDVVKQADDLEQQAAARKAEQSDEIKTTWATSAEHLNDVFQRVLKQTSDLEQRLESHRSSKTETELPTPVEPSLEANEDNSIEARLQRVREGHKQLDELEKQLDAKRDNRVEAKPEPEIASPAIEVKKDDFTEDHMRQLRELEKGKPSHKLERYPDVVEFDDTLELPAQTAKHVQEDEQTTTEGRRFRVSPQKVLKRLTHVMQKSYTEINTRITDYLNDEKGGWDRAEKRKWLATYTPILGAAAIYLGMKYGVDLDLGSDGGSASAFMPDSPDTAKVDVQPVVSAGNSEVYQMETGDTLWGGSEADITAEGIDVSGHNPEDLALIDAVTDNTAELNNFADPDNLSVGTEVRKLSPEEIKELAKQYKG